MDRTMRLLRKLDKATWWDIDESATADDDSSVGADAYKNARTTLNGLSIFEVPTDDDIGLALAALVAGGKDIDVADYCLFDSGLLDEIGIAYKRCDGATPIEAANHLHYDMVDLTARSLYQFVSKLCLNRSLGRLSEDDIRAKLITLHKGGKIRDLHKLSAGIQKAIQER